jgi:hypothetical protein
MDYLLIIRPSINIFWATNQKKKKEKRKKDHPYIP